MSEKEIALLSQDKELVIKLTNRKIYALLISALSVCLTCGYIGGGFVGKVDNDEKRITNLENWRDRVQEDKNIATMEHIKNVPIAKVK